MLGHVWFEWFDICDWDQWRCWQLTWIKRSYKHSTWQDRHFALIRSAIVLYRFIFMLVPTPRPQKQRELQLQFWSSKDSAAWNGWHIWVNLSGSKKTLNKQRGTLQESVRVGRQRNWSVKDCNSHATWMKSSLKTHTCLRDLFTYHILYIYIYINIFKYA